MIESVHESVEFSPAALDDIYIVYLHGFLSSPKSVKARLTLKYCQNLGLGQRIYIPELEFGPARTIEQLTQFIAEKSQYRVVLIGSSLGGFYAACLADRLNLRAALINPAVMPHQFWRQFLGEHKSFYSDKTHIVTRTHVEELRALHTPEVIHPGNILLLAQKEDETLDYRQAEERYRFSRCIIQDGGNHSFENFEAVLPTIFDFFAIKN